MPLNTRFDLFPLDMRRRRKQSGEGGGSGGGPKPKQQKFLGLPSLTKASRLRLFLQRVARQLTGHSVRRWFNPTHHAVTKCRGAAQTPPYHAANQRDGPDRRRPATERCAATRNLPY